MELSVNRLQFSLYADPQFTTHANIDSPQKLASEDLYISDGVCSRCYPTTSYCRGHMGRIQLSTYHIAHICKTKVDRLLRLICLRCHLPLKSLPTTASVKTHYLYTQLIGSYQSLCNCTGAPESKRNVDLVGVLQQVYIHFRSMNSDVLWRVFKVPDNALRNYVLVPPRELLEHIPGGRDILKAYEYLLALQRRKHTAEDEAARVNELYSVYESALRNKHGILRQMLVSKRLGNSMRAVIVSNVHIGLCDIVVPGVAAKHLVKQTILTRDNMSMCISSITRNGVLDITYGKSRYKLASNKVHLMILGIDQPIPHGSVVRSCVTDEQLVTYTTGSEYKTLCILNEHVPVYITGGLVVTNSNSVTLYVDAVDSESAFGVIRLPLQIGAALSCATGPQPVLVHRNPVLSADSMHIHNMLIDNSSDDAALNATERQLQRVHMFGEKNSVVLNPTGTGFYSSNVVVGGRLSLDRDDTAFTVYRVTSTAKREYTGNRITNTALSVHPLAITSYQGDFDGDEINVAKITADQSCMSLLGDMQRESFKLVHDAKYGYYLLIHDVVSIDKLHEDCRQIYMDHLGLDEPVTYTQLIPTSRSVMDLLTNIRLTPNRESVDYSAYFSEFCRHESYAAGIRRDYKHESDYVCVSRFYADVCLYLCAICDYYGIDYNSTNREDIVASGARPSASTIRSIYESVGPIRYTGQRSQLVVNIKGNYAHGVSESEYIHMCYTNREQVVTKGISVAPEGDNMRLGCNYMTNYTTDDNRWSSHSNRDFFCSHMDTRQNAVNERRAIRVSGVYYSAVHQDSQRLAYRPISELPADLRQQRENVIHIGQRKLLMSEIDFLTDYARGDCVVVYAGAAPGTHISVLLKLFPRVKFHLYDRFRFNSKVATHSAVEIHQEYITAEIAAKYSQVQKLLYISDIRTAESSAHKPTDDHVAADNSLNCAILDAMNPCAAMLKFRLPFTSGSSRLPVGQLRYQCWTSAASTEVRLICNRPYVYTAYDHTTHEQIMYYHNTTRPYSLQDVYVNGHVSTLLNRLKKQEYYDAYRESHIVAKLLSSTDYTEDEVYALIDRVPLTVRNSS